MEIFVTRLLIIVDYFAFFALQVILLRRQIIATKVILIMLTLMLLKKQVLFKFKISWMSLKVICFILYFLLASGSNYQ